MPPSAYAENGHVESDHPENGQIERTASDNRADVALRLKSGMAGGSVQVNGLSGNQIDSTLNPASVKKNGGIGNASNAVGNRQALDDATSDYGDGKGPPRLDEYDVDFSDTRRFAVGRWNDILCSASGRLLPSDLQIVSKYHDWHHLSTEIQSKIDNPTSTPVVKREMRKIQQMPKSLATLIHDFSQLVMPFEVKYDLVWALVYLNLKLSYASPDRLKRTVDLLFRIRRVIDLFNRCIQACDEDNESRIAVVDFLEPLTIIFTDSIMYLRDYSSDRAANDAWPALKESIDDQMSTLDQTVRHVADITTLSRVNQDRQIKNMSLRHALVPEPEEHGTFPNRILPSREENPNFYGRADELDRIEKYLQPTGDQSFRSYTIYGRRGVGKTEIALQFAHTNPCAFDAIFWIQCETSVAIRESFTRVAVNLNLPGSDAEGHHEENLLKVHEWLKRTKKRWLLIFDNAEKDQILKQYWPVGVSGAILVTSRKYYNFVKDTGRRGDTIKPFDHNQSWDLLLQYLGNDWKKMDEENRIAPSEVASAKSLLSKLDGLALAIQQAAQLIKDPEIGGPTITKTYERFEKRLRTLPERHSSARSASERALDTLWDMIFNALTPNARVLLGVLAWLSPDSIQTQLFSPRNQAMLDGPLAWCRQQNTDENQRATLYKLITPTPAFERAIKELLSRDLIKQTGPRLYSVHRVVQEAINWRDVHELQESFQTAARLVFEQFPKRDRDDNFYNKWSICQDYIQHGVQLSRKFQDYDKSGNLKGSQEFIALLSNCAWYLYEIGDYNTSLRVLETATMACTERSTLAYADLRNTAGARYYELNLLTQCRAAWEECKDIREKFLPHDDISIAAIYNNLGNVELAVGNTEEAIECYDRATQIWVNGGDATATRLALTYLCIGRVRMLQGKLTEAMELTAWSEDLFVRTTGKEKGFMANVHYAYGNIKLRQKHLEAAWRDYDTCLKICLQNMSIHPLTAATYYSLGRIEFLQGHSETARMFFDKARSISELRSPDRDDGPTARILWHIALLLESDPYNAHATEAEEFRKRAEVAQQRLLAEGEGGTVPRIPGHSEDNDEKFSFDSLVPLFFR